MYRICETLNNGIRHHLLKWFVNFTTTHIIRPIIYRYKALPLNHNCRLYKRKNKVCQVQIINTINLCM